MHVYTHTANLENGNYFQVNIVEQSIFLSSPTSCPVSLYFPPLFASFPDLIFDDININIHDKYWWILIFIPINI